VKSLAHILLSAPERDALVAELAATLDQHIASRSGLKGTTMKAGFASLKLAQPDIAGRAVRALLPQVVEALDPLYAEFLRHGSADFGAFLAQHAAPAATQLLAATDARIGNSRNTTAQALYKRFRGSASEELTALLPALGRVLGKYAA